MGLELLASFSYPDFSLGWALDLDLRKKKTPPPKDRITKMEDVMNRAGLSVYSICLRIKRGRTMHSSLLSVQLQQSTGWGRGESQQYRHRPSSSEINVLAGHSVQLLGPDPLHSMQLSSHGLHTTSGSSVTAYSPVRHLETHIPLKLSKPEWQESHLRAPFSLQVLQVG